MAVLVEADDAGDARRCGASVPADSGGHRRRVLSPVGHPRRGPGPARRSRVVPGRGLRAGTRGTRVVARLVPGVTEGGFDPAAGYRRFDDSIERLESGT